MNHEIRVARLAHNALLNLAALTVPLIVAFFTLPIIIRGLGPSRFGVLTIAWMILTYLTDLGFGSTTTRYAAEAIGTGRYHKLSSIVWTTARLQVMVGLMEGVLLVLVTPVMVNSILKIPPGLIDEARVCLFLSAACLPIVGLARSFRGLTEAAQRFDLSLIVHMPLTAATYIFAAIGAVLSWSVPLIFTVIVISKLLSVPAFMWTAKRALPGVSLRPEFARDSVRELTSFTGWVAISSVVSPLLTYLDRLMVGALLSMAAVTYYSAPYELIARLALIPAGVAGALYPAFSQLNAQREQAERIAARATNMIVLTLAPLVMLAVGLAHDGLAIWLGPQYADRSAAAFQILGIGVLINAAAHVPYGLLQGHGRPDVPAYFHMLELPIQIALAWILIRSFGITGAAMAWTARVLLDAMLLFTATARMDLLDVRALQHARIGRTLTITVVALIASVGSSLLFPVATRVSGTIVVAAIAAVLLWRLSVSADDRTRLLRLVTLRG